MTTKFKLNKKSKFDFSNLDLKHMFNYILGGALPKTLYYLFILFISTKMSPKDYGQLSLYGVFVLIFSIILSFNFSGSIKQKWLKDNRDFASFLYTTILSQILLCFLLSTLLLWNIQYISEFLNVNKEVYIYAIYTSWGFIFINSYYNLLQARKQSLKFGVFSLSQVLLEISFIIFIYYFIINEGYFVVIYGKILSLIVLSLIILSLLVREMKFKFKKIHLLYAFSFSLPLIIHSLSTLLLSQVDRIMIGKIIGSREVGLYSLAYNVCMALQIIIIAVSNTWVPFLYEKIKTNEFQEIKSRVKIYSWLIAIIISLFMFFSKYIIYIFSDSQYYDAITLIPELSFSFFFFFVYIIYINYLFFLGETKLISIISLFSVIINIILNYYLLPYFGYKISAVSTLFSYFILAVLSYCFLRKKKIVIVEAKYFFKPLLLVGVFYYLLS